MYDIIGDLHGHAGELIDLLKNLGYRHRSGHFSHSSRQVVFVGDFIDRGPRILETLRIVRSMVDAGSALAVMGNHEFNAIAFHTEDPRRPGEYFRARSDKNVHQHLATLRQLSCQALADYVDWFKTLPVALERKGVRVVHACWDPRGIKTIEGGLKKFGRFTTEFLAQASSERTQLHAAVERVLKGPEVPLPKGVAVPDKEGNVRREMRIRWFEAPDGHTYSSYALPALARDDLPRLRKSVAAEARPYASDAPPVFFGHYWLRARRPQPLATNIACLDYSVAKNGMLCAYRWNSGSGRLSSKNFVWVEAGGK